MKSTWIWFKPGLETDGLGTVNEKMVAIEKCVKELIRGCRRIFKMISYAQDPKEWGVAVNSGLIVIVNHIEGLSAVLYEEESAGHYSLTVDEGIGEGYRRTPVTDRPLDSKRRSEIVNMYKLPHFLDIRKYLNHERD